MADKATYRPPGALGNDDMPNVTMMICTAGHVDHGKTRLVKLLTGCETDRLKTEQERGLTIELGFAPCVIGGDTCVGIVDVPGHEKFIRNMVAGVSGIGMCVLVIAADDCIKPQTVEHLRIMEFMGVPHGIVALTKTDLVDENRLGKAKDDIRAFLKGTFLDGAPVCPVSSETFEGYFEFYDTLTKQIALIKRKERYGVFRMPVEQVFKQAGFGSVVMGIPIEGSIDTGDTVVLCPGGAEGRVRGIQQFLHDTDHGEYGQCLALNIPEYGKKPPARGEVIAAGGRIEPSMTVHVRLRAVPELGIPVKNAEPVKFHTGTAEVNGKLYLLEGKELAARESALAAIVLNDPVVAAPHDRFIVRRPSPAATIAGGEILALSQDSGKPRKRMVLEDLAAYEAFLGGNDPVSAEGIVKRIECMLMKSGVEQHIDSIAGSVFVPVKFAERCLDGLVKENSIRPLDAAYYIHADAVAEIIKKVTSKIEEASADGKTLTLSTGELRKGFDYSPRLWQIIEQTLETDGLISRKDNTILLGDAFESMNADDRALAEKITAIYRESGFSSPRPDEIPALLGAEIYRSAKIIDYLAGQGILVRLSKTVVLSRESYLKAQDIVVGIVQSAGQLDSGDFKQHIGSTRKYALAILDFLDSRHITIRSGNVRTLSPDYERRLLS